MQRETTDNAFKNQSKWISILSLYAEGDGKEHQTVIYFDISILSLYAEGD